jgi:hypothetical protein
MIRLRLYSHENEIDLMVKEKAPPNLHENNYNKSTLTAVFLSSYGDGNFHPWKNIEKQQNHGICEG